MNPLLIQAPYTSKPKSYKLAPNSTLNMEPLEPATQTFQNPLIKEYTLNYSRILNMI